MSTLQEEADTRLLLHEIHDDVEGYNSVIIGADNTDVLVLCMAFQCHINCDLYVKCGASTRTRILDVKKLCAAVRAFSGQGKLKALKLLLGSAAVQTAFTELGQCRHSIC